MSIRTVIATLVVLIMVAFDLRADLPLEIPNQTNTLRPPALTGRWRGVGVHVENQFLTISSEGKVRLGPAGSEVLGHTARLTEATVVLYLRPRFGERRVWCTWKLNEHELILFILQSRSRTDERDKFQALDEDRSLEMQTWRFRRAR